MTASSADHSLGNDLPSPTDRYAGRKVTVMGLGRFGGGLGAVEFLLSRGAKVRVTDLRSAADLAESLARIDVSRLDELVLGEHPERLFTEADLVVVNPAVKRSHPALQLARAHHIPLTSEMNLFWEHQRGKIVGVTGSNGKSTTTALLHHLLRLGAGERNGRVWLGGNLGGSLLPHVDEIAPEDWVVLELSSFMLADLDHLRRSPHLAVVTGFAPNHLDWHPDLADYRRAKQTILRWQTAADWAVLNADDPDVREWPATGRLRWFGEQAAAQPGVRVVETRLECVDEQGAETFELRRRFALPGRHNRWNAAAAVAAARALGVPSSQIRQGLATFEGLPHRLQLVAEGRGRRFYNDSLATTPESAICALEAFDAPVILLAGGYDKQVDLTAFAETIGRRVKGVALLGQTAPLLADVLDRTGGTLERCRPGSLEEAFKWAVTVSSAGDVVLLSPGCASYDWFKNFAERGDRFTRLAREWTAS